MRTTQSSRRTVGMPTAAAEAAAAAAAAESLREPRPEADAGIRLQLTVWPGMAGSWRARLELPGAATRAFDSPFELARFLAQLPARHLSLAKPEAGVGLR